MTSQGECAERESGYQRDRAGLLLRIRLLEVPKRGLLSQVDSRADTRHGCRPGAAGTGALFRHLRRGGRRAKRGIRPGLEAVAGATVPVVSVGNITLGGTGKTPMVEWVARWYRRKGVRVALISRGYGHAGGINDEGLVLEENLPDVPHLQDPDRVKLATIATTELDSELIILDDGFQHRRLARDLDLVMIDALDPFGPGKLFPRGLLRESLHSLQRASAVVLSRADLIEPAEREQIRRQVRDVIPELPFIEARHAPVDLIDCEGHAYPLCELAETEIAAFCGIGNPEGFRRHDSSSLQRRHRPEGFRRPSPL